MSSIIVEKISLFLRDKEELVRFLKTESDRLYKNYAYERDGGKSSFEVWGKLHEQLPSDVIGMLGARIIKVLKNIGEITVRSSLTDFTFLVSESILENQTVLLNEVNRNKDVFYTSSRGVNELNIVVSNILDEAVEDLFKNEKCTQKAENLSSITVKLPAENVSVPGIYYFIFQRLAWEGIVLYEVISTTNEFTIIVNDEQVDVAFKTIKDLKTL